MFNFDSFNISYIKANSIWFNDTIYNFNVINMKTTSLPFIHSGWELGHLFMELSRKMARMEG
jgi:hypothetical protein